MVATTTKSMVFGSYQKICVTMCDAPFLCIFCTIRPIDPDECGGLASSVTMNYDPRYQPPPSQYGCQQYGYPQPPRKKPVSTLLVLAIMVGAGVAITFAVVVAAVVDTPSTPYATDAGPSKAEQLEQSKRAMEAELAKAAAAKKEARLAKLRKACGMKPDAGIEEPVFDDIRYACYGLVKEGLKAPSSAEFAPAPPSGVSGFLTDDGCRYIFDSWVEALNPFGVKLRTRYRCIYDPRTDKLTVESL